MDNPRVTVLISTYNGDKYLKQQLDSIIKQDGVEITIVARDDGSTDRTVELLRQYKEFTNLSLIEEGTNIGPQKSFGRLIELAPDNDFYAFSDQDDIWYSEKLRTGIEAIKTLKGPALYMSNQNCVNENGEYLFKRLPEYNIQPNFLYTLFRNNYAGCTMIINKQLMKQLKIIYRKGGKKLQSIHDGLALEIAQLTGQVVYDPKPHMDFRRHNNNYSEAQLFTEMNNKLKLKLYMHKFKSAIKAFKYRGMTTYECGLLLTCFEKEIDAENRDYLKYVIGYKKNLKNWMQFFFKNKLKEYMPEPRITSYLKILLLFY